MYVCPTPDSLSRTALKSLFGALWASLCSPPPFFSQGQLRVLCDPPQLVHRKPPRRMVAGVFVFFFFANAA